MFLVTGIAGFIGFHTAKNLLQQGNKVVGIDNLNDYYDVALKKSRLEELKKYGDYQFLHMDIADQSILQMKELKQVKHIIHLAAQAGVRYSLNHPFAYLHSNLAGHLVMLELARNTPNLQHFIYASSSSIYGANEKIPFSVEDQTDKPISLYAATKKSAELMSYCYHHLYGFNIIGLRFFTVYGPWGRPDMAAFQFTKNILEEKEISLYNHGKMKRDFTYIDDIITAIMACIHKDIHGNKIYNLGNNKPEQLEIFVQEVEKATGKKAIIRYEDLQPGDVVETYADITLSSKDLGFAPKISISEGIPKFIDWYRSYYMI